MPIHRTHRRLSVARPAPRASRPHLGLRVGLAGLISITIGMLAAGASARAPTVSWTTTSYHLDLPVLENRDVFAGARREFETGDFNGDGYDDLAVGFLDFPLWTGTQLVLDVGIVQVLYGGPGGLEPESRQTFSEYFLNDGRPAHAQAYFGHTLGAGDFDADGCDDLAIASGTGNVYVLPGSPRPFGSGFGGLSNQGSYRIPTHVSWGGLAVGDFNGDWYTDLAAATFHDFKILFGTSGRPLTDGDLQGIDGEELHPDVVGPFALHTMDLDGDVFDDLVISNPSWEIRGMRWAGSLFVLRGSRDGFEPRAAQRIGRDSGYIPGAPRENATFPVTVHGARLHGPNRPVTLLLGNPGAYKEGELLMIPTDRNGLRVADTRRLVQTDVDRRQVVEPGDLFAEHIVSFDFDGDGLEEVALSSLEWHGDHFGQVTIVGFDPVRMVPTLSYVLPSNAVPAAASWPGDISEGLVTGDFDGDGMSELIVASRDWTLPNDYTPRSRAFHLIDFEVITP